MKATKEKTDRPNTAHPLDSYEVGVDELNLAEYSLSSISERIPAGLKTIVFEDQIFDRNEGRTVERRLTISGSDRYGLPTATDDDVLLACLQLSKLQGFASPVVIFSRYELLKLLRWSDDTRNYHRLAQSLRRWKGLSIFSDRAFYDHQEKSWVNRDFGVFDTLLIYRREVNQGSQASAASKFTWNEVLFRSFQAGYLKRFDWGLYTRLQSPVAKRLYRFLDKRFYHGKAVEIDLRELALRKLRLSENYNVAQMKRVLQKGIEELQSHWELKALPDKQRYDKRGRGLWTVRFERKAKPKSIERAPQPTITLPAIDPTRLEFALTKRGIGPATANELAEQYPSRSVQTMIELFDWYNSRRQPRGAGFLVNAIKNPQSIVFPNGFQSTAQVAESKPARKLPQATGAEFLTRRERQHLQVEESRQRAFQAFWCGLSPQQQIEFENSAVDSAPSTKRAGYYRAQGEQGRIFEQYRTLILRDHYERTHGTTVGKEPKS